MSNLVGNTEDRFSRGRGSYWSGGGGGGGGGGGQSLKQHFIVPVVSCDTSREARKPVFGATDKV